MGEIYFAILRRIERAGYDVFSRGHPRPEAGARLDRRRDLAKTLMGWR